MTTKANIIKHDVHTVDASGEVLGRLATKVAQMLVGKNKPYFVRHLDCGDGVIVNNATKIVVTGGKERKKTYTRFSGYPGGLKTLTFKKLQEKAPAEIIRRAVSGMLPNNKLKRVWLARLKINV